MSSNQDEKIVTLSVDSVAAEWNMQPLKLNLTKEERTKELVGRVRQSLQDLIDSCNQLVRHDSDCTSEITVTHGERMDTFPLKDGHDFDLNLTVKKIVHY